MPIDYKNYHPKWSLIVYLIKFKRAQNRCEWCGIHNSKEHPITGSKVVLSIAHINQDRTFNRFYNLAALCQRCHLNHDRKQHIFNRKYGRLTKYVCGKLFDVPYKFSEIREYKKKHWMEQATLLAIERKRRKAFKLSGAKLFIEV